VASPVKQLHDRRASRRGQPLTIGDLLAAIAAADVELRIVPSLVPLGRAIIQTTLHFSLIRMRNARGWADG